MNPFFCDHLQVMAMNYTHKTFVSIKSSDATSCVWDWLVNYKKCEKMLRKRCVRTFLAPCSVGQGRIFNLIVVGILSVRVYFKFWMYSSKIQVLF